VPINRLHKWPGAIKCVDKGDAQGMCSTVDAESSAIEMLAIEMKLGYGLKKN